jgi:arsenical resistance protein ArsH
MEELVTFTWLTRGRSGCLADRYSERVETAADVSRRVNRRASIPVRHRIALHPFSS